MGTLICTCRFCHCWLPWVCGTVVIVAALICTCVYLIYRLNHIKSLTLEKLDKEEEIKKSDFQRKKDWEEFLQELNAKRAKSQAEKSDDKKIASAKESILAYAKSLMILDDIIKQSKPLDAEVIKKGMNDVEAFMENIKALSDQSVLDDLLKTNKNQ